MAPLVPAERLPRREAPVAHGAPVLAPGAGRRVRGRCRSFLGRRRRAYYTHGQWRRPFPVAGLVPAERLVGREGLPADGAPEPELAGRRRCRRGL